MVRRVDYGYHFLLELHHAGDVLDPRGVVAHDVVEELVGGVGVATGVIRSPSHSIDTVVYHIGLGVRGGQHTSLP